MKYDVVVIGGGPAGMMAAGRAAERGARVLLLEKNSSLGKKLLITGGGRSNVTNAEFDEHIFLGKFCVAGKFLFSPLAAFGVQATLDFFHKQGMPTKVEAEKRVFPESNTAQSVWDALVVYMRAGQVAIRTESEVAGFETADGKISAVRLKNGEVIQAGSYILATGGKSRPETGSTGDGFRWLSKIGHTVTEPSVALVPLRIREKWAHSLSGLSFPEAKLTVYQNGEKQESRKGKILFTHVGLSGPLVLNMSHNISEFLQYGEVRVSVDLYPGKNIGELDKELQGLFEGEKNKQIKNIVCMDFSPPSSSPLF